MGLLSVLQARAQAMRRASGVRRNLSAPVSVTPDIQEPLAPLAAHVAPSPSPSTAVKVPPLAPPTAGVYMHSATNPGVLNTRAMEDFTREVRRSPYKKATLYLRCHGPDVVWSCTVCRA